ncbi:hypothetical protein TSOC_001094 [Tetrabaena socialis]|uniref:N-acetyltransferase domain-containing protein n=1 Tax=Tetrabaena socialis TaxID=47790 RepID=A0A2J8AHN9_9CHLO|nr:hypothetical protein TSOC_001094 [Tetrabaena socialis]|eukprot:PNH12032.1 hypothetical protein TSOC_001094 [Tetrabaena socialis]
MGTTHASAGRPRDRAAAGRGTLERGQRLKVDTAQGRLVVYRLARGDVQAAGVVLTRAFAGTAESVALSAVLQDIQSMARDGSEHQQQQQHQEQQLPQQQPEPQAESQQDIFLVARLYPSDPSSALLPPGQASRLIGTAAVSLSPASQLMRRLPPANLPPPSAAYVSNMAVDPKFRRRGVARALLAACEEVARRAGSAEAWLHVREADAPARGLYDKEGYVVVSTDTWLDTMRYGMRARLLMRRAL